jgi:hypothetical protein
MMMNTENLGREEADVGGPGAGGADAAAGEGSNGKSLLR